MAEIIDEKIQFNWFCPNCRVTDRKFVVCKDHYIQKEIQNKYYSLEEILRSLQTKRWLCYNCNWLNSNSQHCVKCQKQKNEQITYIKDLILQVNQPPLTKKEKKEIRKLKEDTEELLQNCYVCKKEKKTHMNLNCLHYCLCENCAFRTKTCPICRISGYFVNPKLKF